MKNSIPHFPLYLGGQAKVTSDRFVVTHKYTGLPLAEVSLAGPAELESAVQAATDAAPVLAALPHSARRQVLRDAIRKFETRRTEFETVLCQEVGKPLRDAKVEVDRFLDTFEIAYEECGRTTGEVLDLDRVPRSQGYRGFTRRVPIGPCLFISPFNFPLNLTAHKIAPALATGCPFILKPASRTPLSALMIGEVLSQLELPAGSFSILPSTREIADRLVGEPRLKLLSFTGSPDVGWDLKARAGKKKVVLELGGNAACIVDQSANVETAVSRLVTGIFSQSGQSCISVQRILVHESLYGTLKTKLLAATRQVKVGDPSDPETIVGPLIDEKDAIRLEQWVRSAVARGATLLTGGDRQGSVFAPTLLEKVPTEEPLYCQEAFGPVAILESFSDFGEALRQTNRGQFGLQAGVFTNDLSHAHRAWNELEVGGVIINDIPAWRADQMPYGGVKDSGLGREGVRYAMEDMTEIRLMVVKS